MICLKVGCNERFTAYPENDIFPGGELLSLESCHEKCFHDTSCRVFTYTINKNDPTDGVCRLKSSRGKTKRKVVAEDKISGGGRMTCPGI